MFGCVVAGRLLQTNLQQIDETHALFEIADAGSINHISVFLLGTGRCHFHFFKLYRRNIQFCSTVPRRIWCYRSFPLARKRIPIIRDVSMPFPVRPPFLSLATGYRTKNRPQYFVSAEPTRQTPQLPNPPSPTPTPPALFSRMLRMLQPS